MAATIDSGAGTDTRGWSGWASLGAAGFLAVGAYLLVDAFSGRHLELPKGQAFWGVVYAWVGVVWALLLWRRRVGRQLAPGAAALVSLVGLVPGGAVLWYAVWAWNQTTSGVCRTRTGGTTSCVQGPAALVPWAVLLLAAAVVLTVRTYRRRRRSTPAA